MLHSTSLISALLLVSAVSGNQLPAAQNSGLTLQFTQGQSVTVSVSGTVRDKRSNSPIPNAQLRAHIALWAYQPSEWLERCPYQEAVTDAQGNYHITFLTPLTTAGPMSGKDGLCVSASLPGYGSLPHWCYVTASRCVFTNMNFALEAGKHVRGVVVNAAGQPVSGAVVRVQNGENGDWNSFGSLGRTTTGADGSFEVWFGVAATRNSIPWVSVLKEAVGTRVLYGVVAREDFGSITLNPGAALAGKVVDAGGKPVPNCEVSVRRRMFDLVCKTHTDQEGRYLLTGIPGEATMKEFASKRGRSYRPALGEADVYARVNPDMKLKDAPSCKIIVKEGQTLACPDLVVGGESSEARLGQAEDLGNVVLKAGLDKAKVIQDKRARALQQPQEITQAAQELFKKIRTANYDYFLKNPVEWQRFPIFGHYWYGVEGIDWHLRTGRQAR